MKKFSLLILCLSSFLSWAQPDKENLGQFELSVTDRYKAQVVDAKKILDRPSYSDSINQRIAVQYRIFSTPIPVKMQPEALSPARIAKIEVPELYNGYVRTAYGMYNTALAEAYYNSGRSAKYSYGFSARHLSTQTGVEDLVFEDNAMSKNHLGAYFNRYYRKYTWSNSAEVNLDKFSYYGNPRLGLSNNEDSTRGAAPFNWYRNFAYQTSLKEANTKSMGWLEQISLGLRHFTDNYQSQEQDFQLNTKWNLPAGDKELHLELNSAYFQNKIDSLYAGISDTAAYSQNTFQIQARPYIHMEKEAVSFDFGLNLFVLNQMDSRPDFEDNRIFFFPELILKWKMIPGVLNIKGGLKGELQRNTFRNLSLLSPFLAPGQLTRAGGENRAFITMEGILASNLSFNVEGGYQIFTNRALVFSSPVFDRSLNDVLNVNVSYQDMNVLYAKGAIDFNWSDKFLLNMSATARSYDMAQSGQQPWNLPFFEAHLNTHYNLKDKIGIGLNLDFIGARFASNFNYPEQEALLAPYVDLGLKLDYRYNSRIGAFINLSNLLNSQYEILLGYRAQSISAMFGLNYRF